MPTVIDTVEVHYACREGLVYLKVDPSLLSPRAEPKPSAAASGRAASAKQASGGPIDLTGDSDEEGPRPSQKAPMKRAKASGVVDLT